MKLYTFSTLLIFSLAFLIMGCQAENPVCTDNFCFVGEAFPRSELGNQQFSEVDIDDSKILATFTGVVPIPVGDTDNQVAPESILQISDIVNSADRGSEFYVGKRVAIQAEVKAVYSKSITLTTNNRYVSFFVTFYDNPEKRLDYKKGQQYIFNLFIRDIKWSEFDLLRRNIWSVESD